jgi:hypothetical protein
LWLRGGVWLSHGGLGAPRRLSHCCLLLRQLPVKVVEVALPPGRRPGLGPASDLGCRLRWEGDDCIVVSRGSQAVELRI